jgi:Ca2+-transporting ATPase
MQERKFIENAWSIEAENVLNLLETTEQGLSEEEASTRLQPYGRNVFHKQEQKSYITIFLKQLASPLIFILIGAAVITGVLREWAEVVVITLAVLVNTGLGFYREYHAENTLSKLSTFIKDRARVVRGGHEEEIDSEMLVPGDIIKLAYGGRVAADARIINANNVSTDESILTGESTPVSKFPSIKPIASSVSERNNMVHAGTLTTNGFAAAVVVATGDKTEIGKIASLVSGTHRAKTPIQKGLSKLAWVIFVIVMFIVVGIFLLGVYRGESIFEMLVLSAAVSVGAVPEALPIALTVILSIGAERIARKKGITRTLIAAETLGSTSVIMTDKTGTLTEANMRLVGIYDTDELVSGNTEPKPNDDSDHKLLEMALANVDVLIENPNDEVAKWSFKGKPFEVNIVKTARDNGLDVSRFHSGNGLHIVIPFNSSHKFSVSKNGEFYAVMGAPDILLSKSKMDSSTHDKIESWIIKASDEGKRLVAIGKIFSPVLSTADVHDIEFVGILAFHDPVRKEVPKAIKRIEALGTRIVMVTGDLRGTALSVSRELGWNVADTQVLTGHDLQVMSDEALLAVLPSIKIFARVTPEDKLRIGLLYRKLGEVVAMTGDGVNDAPSLKAMDIGVALGSGSDVAKSAADLVLLDDNFQTISMAIQEGRRILVNIRKTFVYLMSNSLDEVFVIGGSLLMGIALPLSALQIIWVNLFTGSLPALAFAYDEDFDHEMSKRHTLKSIFTYEVNVLTFGIGIFSSLLLFLMYYALVDFGVELALARSVFFVCFASYILVIAFSFRSLHKPLFTYPIFSNKKLNQSILVAVVILIATMVIPALREIFDLAPLPLVWLWFILGWLVLNVFLVEFAKYLFRIKKYRSDPT